MKKHPTLLGVLLIVLGARSLAQGPDPAAGLFPPDLMMQHQKKINLTDDQTRFIKQEVQKVQTPFTELQSQLQGEVEALSDLTKEDRADEQTVLVQLDKVLNAEREIKRAQMGLLVRLKNKLTPEQIAQLRELKRQHKPE